MVLVDIKVPSVNNTYDFQLDENVPVGILIEEISSMIEQKENCQLVGEHSQLMLCGIKQNCIMEKKSTLKDNNIHNGDGLILT